MTRLSQMRSISRMNSWAAPKRVSVSALFSEMIGVTAPYLAFARSSAGIT